MLVLGLVVWLGGMLVVEQNSTDGVDRETMMIMYSIFFIS